MPTRIRCVVDWPNASESEVIDGTMFYVMPAAGDAVQFADGREFTVRKIVHYVSDRPGATTSVVILDPQ